MTVPIELLTWSLGLLGTLIVTGIGYIIRTLAKQNVMLLQLVAQVGTANIGAMERRVSDIEADLSRIWGIYDAWRGPTAPISTTRDPANH